MDVFNIDELRVLNTFLACNSFFYNKTLNPYMRERII